MIPVLCLALLAAPLRAASPEDKKKTVPLSVTIDGSVARILARAEALIAAQKGKDAREIAALDRKARALARELVPLGWRAARPLGAAAKDAARAPKVRLLAASFLALLRDPAAFEQLEDILLDPDGDPSARGLAAQSLTGMGMPDAAVRGALCAAISREDLPRAALDDALIPLSRLGCPHPAALLRVARSFGPRPATRDLATARRALAALGRSRETASGRALLGLVAYFPPRGEARAAAISALEARRLELALWLKPETLPVVIEALRAESGRRDTMLSLIRAAAALGPETDSALERLARHPDAEIRTSAAEARASWRLTRGSAPVILPE